MATLNNITSSRRAILAGTAALPVLAVPTALAYSNPDASLIALCEQLHVLLAEQKAIYAEQSEAYDRALAGFTHPPEISLDVLKTSPLFDGDKYRNGNYGGGYIPSHVIEAALKRDSSIADFGEDQGRRHNDVHRPRQAGVAYG